MESMDEISNAMCAPVSSLMCKRRSGSMRERADVEDAIVKVGEAEGRYEEVGGLEIERDPQFPVRVTLQVPTYPPASPRITAHKQTHTITWRASSATVC
jgi:hypothetical protein